MATLSIPQISIAPALAFLNTHNPSALSAINSTYPVMALAAASKEILFSPAVPAALSPVSEPTLNLPGKVLPIQDQEELREGITAVYLELLNKSIDMIAAKMVLIKNKLTSSKKIKFIGGAMSIITTASFFGIIVTNETLVKIISAIVGLAASLIPTIIQYVNIVVTDDKNLDQIYKELVDLKKKAKKTLSQFDFEKRTDAIFKLIQNGNEIKFDMEELLEFVPLK